MRRAASHKSSVITGVCLAVFVAVFAPAANAQAPAAQKPEKSVDEMLAELEKRASDVPAARLAATFINLGQTCRDAIDAYKANPAAFAPKVEEMPEYAYEGWSYYTFKNYNLKLQYPREIIIDDRCSQDCESSIPVTLKSKPNEAGESEFQMVVLLSKKKFSKTMRMEEFCDSNAQWRKVVTKEKMTTVAGKPTMTYSAPKTPQGDAGKVYTCTIVNDTDVLETIYPVAPVYNEIFKKIVYSIKTTK